MYLYLHVRDQHRDNNGWLVGWLVDIMPWAYETLQTASDKHATACLSLAVCNVSYADTQ